MTHYINVKMRISESQKDKLNKASVSNSKPITIRLTFSDQHGEDAIALTNSQLDRLLEHMKKRKA